MNLSRTTPLLLLPPTPHCVSCSSRAVELRGCRCLGFLHAAAAACAHGTGLWHAVLSECLVHKRKNTLTHTHAQTQARKHTNTQAHKHTNMCNDSDGNEASDRRKPQEEDRGGRQRRKTEEGCQTMSDKRSCGHTVSAFVIFCVTNMCGTSGCLRVGASGDVAARRPASKTPSPRI